jgi:hypothetical protein
MDVTKNIQLSLCKLQDLAGERDKLEHEMGKLHLAIRALCNLVDDRAEREAYKAILDRYAVRTGLTDLVMHCLNTLDKPLTPSEIRNFIKNYGSEASQSQNLLQSVHTILKRLEESGKAKQVKNEDGDTAYRPVTIGERLIHEGFSQSTATVTERQFGSLSWLANPNPMAPRTRSHKSFGQRLLEGDKKK